MPPTGPDFYLLLSYLDDVLGFFNGLLHGVGIASLVIVLAVVMLGLQVLAWGLSRLACWPWLQWLLRIALLVKSTVLTICSGLILALSMFQSDQGAQAQQTSLMIGLWEFFAITTALLVFAPSVIVLVLSARWMRRKRTIGHTAAPRLQG
jgi:hypothetical protein